MHNVRSPDRVKQETLLNLGSKFSVPPSDWSALCVRIEELLSGQTSLMPALSKELEAHAAVIVEHVGCGRSDSWRFRRYWFSLAVRSRCNMQFWGDWPSRVRNVPPMRGSARERFGGISGRIVSANEFAAPLSRFRSVGEASG
ncbi:MAG: hypothetical protein OXI05_11290 [Bacteroidota bacterium]|nr:hypothetical protein [Bacteroidota bacterium]